MNLLESLTRMNKHLNIILANCTVSNGNRGCVALSISIMSIIDELLTTNGIDYTFYLPQSGCEQFGQYTVSCGEKRLSFIAICDYNIYGFKNIIRSIYHIKNFFVAMNIWKKTDFVLDIGQGDSFADIYGKQRFDQINSAYKNGRVFHKPYCILPQTIGPYSDEAIRKEAIKSIKNSRCVMTRDKQSYDYVKSMLPNKEVREIIDVAFFMPYIKKSFPTGHVHVGLNVSALLWHGGYTRDNQFGLKDDYQKVVRTIIDYFLTISNVTLHLVPHVVGGEQHIENDYAVSYNLCEEYSSPQLVLAPLFLNPIIAKGYISGLDFFIGARMHTAIGAFSSGVPVVPMAYSRKFNGLFFDTLNYHHMVDLKKDTNEQILENVSNSFHNRILLKAEIVHAMNSVVEDRKQQLNVELSVFLGIRNDGKSQ